MLNRHCKCPACKCAPKLARCIMFPLSHPLLQCPTHVDGFSADHETTKPGTGDKYSLFRIRNPHFRLHSGMTALTVHVKIGPTVIRIVRNRFWSHIRKEDPLPSDSLSYTTRRLMVSSVLFLVFHSGRLCAMAGTRNLALVSRIHPPHMPNLPRHGHCPAQSTQVPYTPQ